MSPLRIVWLLLATLAISACGADADPSQLLPAAPHERVTNASSALGTCADATISASLLSPQHPGPAIVFTGTGDGCTSPLYQFWLEDATGQQGFQMIRDYTSDPTFTWDTNSLLDGIYTMEVVMRDSTSAADYDTYGNMPFVLQGAGDLCANPTMTASIPSPQSPGPIVTMTATAYTCSSPLYEFVVDDASGYGGWQVVQAFSPSPIFVWDTSTNSDGTYYFGVYVKDATSNAPYDSVGSLTYTLQNTGGVCANVAETASLPSPQQPGPVITLSGVDISGCANPLYEFEIDDNSGYTGWQVVQAYSPNPTYLWDTSIALDGRYYLNVFVKDAASNAQFDSGSGLTYFLQAPGGLCLTPAATFSPSSPEPAGTAVTITASGTTCSNPLYAFVELAPGGNTPWVDVQTWSPNPTYVWDTSSARFGEYVWDVFVKDASSNSPFDDYAEQRFTIAPAGTCGNAAGTANPASPQALGTQVTLSATSGECANPLYEFWQLAPGSNTDWTVVQPWGTSHTYAWDTTSGAAGTYSWQIWVKDAASTTTTFDTSTTFDYELFGTNASCANAAITANHTNPQPVGASVTFTGAATSCSSPQYEFWGLSPNDGWTILQPWSATSSFTWNTASLPPDAYLFEVWTRDVTSSQNYDAYTSVSFTLQ